MGNESRPVTASGKPERVADVKFVGSMPGCYSLGSQKSKDGKPRVFACRIQSISTEYVVLSGPVSGEDGERVLIKADAFPVLQGKLVRSFDGGLAAGLVFANEDERAQLASKIEWTKKNRLRLAKDKREHKRIMPPNPKTSITFDDGHVESCFVIDVSSSGAAVSSSTVPEIDGQVSIGDVKCVVMRQLEEGFAVKFLEEINLDDLSALIPAMGTTDPAE